MIGWTLWCHDRVDVMVSCPAGPGIYSFFNASAGLVRAARRVCQRTETREVQAVNVTAIAVGSVYDMSMNE